MTIGCMFILVMIMFSADMRHIRKQQRRLFVFPDILRKSESLGCILRKVFDFFILSFFCAFQDFW